MGRTTVKVDRLLLIKALEDEQKKQTEQFKRGMERFRESESSYQDRLVAAMEKATADVKRGKIPGKGYNNVPSFANFPERVSKPSRNGTACQLERMIKTLKLSKQETVNVGEGSEYVRFICEL